MLTVKVYEPHKNEVLECEVIGDVEITGDWEFPIRIPIKFPNGDEWICEWNDSKLRFESEQI